MKGKPVLTEAVSCSMIFIHSRRNLLSVIFLQRRSCCVRSLAGSAGISFMFVVFSDFLNGKECNEFQYNFICRRRRTAGGTDPCGGGRVERAARVSHGRVSFMAFIYQQEIQKSRGHFGHVSVKNLRKHIKRAAREGWIRKSLILRTVCRSNCEEITPVLGGIKIPCTPLKRKRFLRNTG